MRDALLHDLSLLPDISITTTHDARLAPPSHADSIELNQGDHVWDVWQQCIKQADAVWLIAPETGGILARLTQLAQDMGKVVLGCDAHSVAIAASKLACAQQLTTAGVPALPAYRYEDWRYQPATHGWVAKPDDGAGCDDMLWTDDRQALQQWMQPRLHSHVIQTYVPGTAASLSMLCRHGQAWLLSCNEQLITLQDGCFHYAGSILNGLSHYHAAAQDIASQVAAAMPGLAGYVGVDVIVDEEGAMQVIEVNPRLTTSYAGLHAAINCNPAQLILDLLLYNVDFSLPAIQHSKVEVLLDAHS